MSCDEPGWRWGRCPEPLETELGENLVPFGSTATTNPRGYLNSRR
ncbi:MAG: hypothetical protein QW564_01920 [Sulfolobales archaeon]